MNQTLLLLCCLFCVLVVGVPSQPSGYPPLRSSAHPLETVPDRTSQSLSRHAGPERPASSFVAGSLEGSFRTPSVDGTSADLLLAPGPGSSQAVTEAGSLNSRHDALLESIVRPFRSGDNIYSKRLDDHVARIRRLISQSRNRGDFSGRLRRMMLRTEQFSMQSLTFREPSNQSNDIKL